MGRPRVIKTEPTTTISVNLVDAMLVDDFQELHRLKTKPEAMRKIFTDYFGPETITKKQKELRKKLDRQQALQQVDGDQSTIDGVYYPKKTIKDIELNGSELLAFVIEGKGDTTKLAKRHAFDSIEKAVNRGDCKLLENGNYVIVKKWF